MRDKNRVLTKQTQNGFTLVELMVSMIIGLFLISGVFYVYLNSTQSQRIVESEVKLLDDARFILESISFDLRHAGVYGGLNHFDSGVIDKTSMDLFNNISGQCGGNNSSWVTNVAKPVNAANNSNPYSAAGDCIPSASYKTGTDVFDVRYVTKINATTLIADALYINSDVNSGEFLTGNGTASTIRERGVNYQVFAKAYYISPYTDNANDAWPSLHQITLQRGPLMKDTVLLDGVDDMQLQFGLVADTQDPSGSVVTWVNPDNTTPWGRVVAARIWLVLQSKERMPGIDTSVTLKVAGVDKTYPNDGHRRVMVNTTVRLRNMNTGY